jgi:transposase-like protein
MGRQALGTIIAKSILENRIEADHRQIKQGVRVMQKGFKWCGTRKS